MYLKQGIKSVGIVVVKSINENLYKTVVSILFGLIGFFVNFNTIIFPFGDYTVAILFGLLFPLLISLAWGWKCGLLSALAGGTQAMWWLWGPSNGYAIFLVVPPFTLWVVWHGYLTDKRKHSVHRWWQNFYLWEIPFRLLSTLNILTLTRWAIQQNPPDWGWAAGEINTISSKFCVFISIKQAIVAYILLLAADVLLTLPLVRTFFRLPPLSNKKHGHIISFAMLVGFFYWFLDSFLFAYLTDDHRTFIDYLARDIPSTNLTTRVVVITASLVVGLFTYRLIYRQKENEIALQEIEKESINREALLSSLINAIPDLVWLKDGNGTYLACNLRFEDLYGAKEKQIIGRTDYDFVDKELADFFRMHDENAMNKRCACTNEEEVTFASDGHCELVETTKTPMYNDAGELIGILGIGRDITERTLMQEQLEQSRKFESLGRMAGGVAHDFNNMLSVILGNSELILAELPPNSPSKELVEQILYAATRSAGLTRQLLTFARKQTILPETMDLNHVIESVLKMLRRLIGENIELNWRPGENLWPIRMDPGQMDQILANMCVNARDAIPDIGTITIETRNIAVDEVACLETVDAEVQDYVVLTIRDTGCGMTKDIQEHIFEPFYTTKSFAKGTGLGLATVYGIMKQNHGFITVTSEVKKGSIFTLFFPKSAEAEKDRPEPLSEKHEEAASGSETILLVEDEPVILKTTRTRLEQLGYTVHAYSNPNAALTACKEIGHIDLLITDVIMPQMNGRDLAEKATALHPEMKTLFMSGYTADVISHHGILHKGIHFINKPFTIKEFSDRVRKILDT